MDNAGTKIASSRGKCAEMVKQSVYQRAGGCASAGVNDHARGLVDGDEVFIFIKDIQRDLFRHGSGLWARKHFDLNDVSGSDTLRRLRQPLADANVAFGD